MRRREGWGIFLTAMAALAFWWGTVVWAAPAVDAAGRRLLFFFLGVPEESITGWIQVISVIGGAIGLLLLVPALIRRIRQRWLRRTFGWVAGAGATLAVPYLALVFVFALLSAIGISDYVRFEAADGRSVLVSQDGFDGDVVEIYTEYDDFHYLENRRANEISGFPRVKNRDCQLAAKEARLLLTCDADTVAIDPGPSREQ